MSVSTVTFNELDFFSPKSLRRKSMKHATKVGVDWWAEWLHLPYGIVKFNCPVRKWAMWMSQSVVRVSSGKLPVSVFGCAEINVWTFRYAR